MANVETATHEHGHGEGDHGHSHGELSHADHGHGDHAHHDPSFFFKYIWSTDHKTIGKQFMITGLIWFMIGGALALAVRYHLAWPNDPVPFLGIIANERYNMLFTMHASIMIFFVIIPMLGGA